MRIAYCTNVRLPSERAHGTQVARVCDALVQLGHEVQIFAPFRRNPIREDYWAFHAVDKRVRLNVVGSFDPIGVPPIPGAIQLWILNAQLRRSLPAVVRRGSFDLLYTRSPSLLPAMLSVGAPTVLEVHAIPRWGRRWFVQLCNRCSTVVCLTTPMRDAVASLGVDPQRIVVEPDAVDLEAFRGEGDRLPLPEISHQPPPEVPRIGYVGQLESMGLSKGVEVLLDALAIIRRRGRRAFGVIARPPPGESLHRRLRTEPDLLFYGFRPHAVVPSILAACDVLVYPAPRTSHPYFVRDTSPLKIFEYMAAQRPIVAADIPPLRDVLDGSTAFLCSPGDPEALADTIESVLQSPENACRRSAEARRRVESHTWDRRMARILSSLPSTHRR